MLDPKFAFAIQSFIFFLNLGRKDSVCLVGTNSGVLGKKIEGQSFISDHNAHSWTKLLESSLFKYPAMFEQIQSKILIERSRVFD